MGAMIINTIVYGLNRYFVNINTVLFGIDKHTHLILEAFAAHLDVFLGIRNGKSAQARLCIIQVDAVEELKNSSYHLITRLALFGHLGTVEGARAENKRSLMLCRGIMYAQNVAYRVLSVAVGGYDNVIVIKIFYAIRKRIFKGKALTVIFAISQNGCTVDIGNRIKDGIELLFTAIVYNDDRLGGFYNLTDVIYEIFGRLICRYDNYQIISFFAHFDRFSWGKPDFPLILRCFRLND